MKALIYEGPGRRSWATKPDPAIEQPTDIVVRIDSSTICGTDLHILKGDVPEVQPGTVLGHEAVGTVVEVGAGVTTVAPDDRVLVSCITSCGRCAFCREGHYGLCTGGGGWIFGHLIDGLQAEFARVPFADTSVYKIPDDAHRRAGAVPGGHPSDRVRGRRVERRRQAGRHGRDRRSRPDRARRDPHGEALHAEPHHRRSISADARLARALEFGADTDREQRPRGCRRRQCSR